MIAGRIRILAVVMAASAGCWGLRSIDRDPADVDRYFTWRGGPSWYAYQVCLEDDRLFGPDLEISRLPEGYRGRVGGVFVDLRVTGRQVSGWVGFKPTQLQVDEQPQGLIVTGVYAGHWGRLDLSADRLTGTVGGHAYDLRRSPSGSRWYQSARGELALPGGLSRLAAADRAILLALVLGGRPQYDLGPTYPDAL